MAKEELKKEAEEYVKQHHCEFCVMADDCESGCIDCFTVQAYIASTEPREKCIEKMKSIGRTAYIKGIRTMANALKRYDRTDGAWTDYFEHTVDTVLKKLLKEVKEQ